MFRRGGVQITPVLLLLLLLGMTPHHYWLLESPADVSSSEGRNGGEVWVDGGQPWPQPGRYPSHNASIPSHSPSGGSGIGAPYPGMTLSSIEDPVVNWVTGDSEDSNAGPEGYSVAVGDLWANVSVSSGAEERCGEGRLFGVWVTENAGESHLLIVEGDSGRPAWRVNLGTTQPVKAAPLLVDVDSDGAQEIVVVFDTDAGMVVELWSPQLECKASGWVSEGHSNERLWRLVDSSRRIGSTTPYTSGVTGNHLAVTQPLIADLMLDDDPELVLATISETTSTPEVVAFPLGSQGPPDSIWEVPLSKGSHPSDPVWVQMDSVDTAVVLTTMHEDNGNLWVWKLDGPTGSIEWEGRSLGNLDASSDSPYIRLPGPIVAQLDDVEPPEVILTIPTDRDGDTSADGAEFVAWSLSEATEIWSLQASNGYADAPPAVLDSDDDGIIDWLCAVTWRRDGMGRAGVAGCYDLSGEEPIEEWTRGIESSEGSLNDRIAVAPPTFHDIDGEGYPEVLVGYALKLYAFDGDTGTYETTGSWAGGLPIPHRCWVEPVSADLDGDGSLDILIGDVMVSNRIADITPLRDGMGIGFSPSQPDPGDLVTITIQVQNIGTEENNMPVDAVLMMDGEEMDRVRWSTIEPSPPTGNGDPVTFSVEWIATLGNHQIDLLLDPLGNITEARVDNNIESAQLPVLAPYEVSISPPQQILRIDPGESGLLEPIITSVGRRTATWSLEWDLSGLPNDWTVVDQTPGGVTSITLAPEEQWMPLLRVSIPSDATGDQSGDLFLTITLDSNPDDVWERVGIPIEVNRTRGLSLLGTEASAASVGWGLPDDFAKAWLQVDNLGNGPENAFWNFTTTEWGGNLTIHEENGDVVNTLELEPNEVSTLSVWLPVPSSAELGSNVTTELNLCIGDGNLEIICRGIEVEFVANGFAAFPSHRRVMPSSQQWELSAQIPVGANNLSWDLSAAGMQLSDWLWFASGDFVIEHGKLIATGSSGELITGTLSLQLPLTTPPNLHRFSTPAIGRDGHSLNLSIEVLQVFQSRVELVSPTTSPIVLEVGESGMVVLRFSNDGNGPDTYLFESGWRLGGNFTSDPRIEVEMVSSQVTLGAGQVQQSPVWVTLPEDLPAKEPVTVAFTLTSLGNTSITSEILLLFEAEPDHSWNVSTPFDRLVAPGVDVEVEITVNNSGNYPDSITLIPSIELLSVDGDPQMDWDDEEVTSNQLLPDKEEVLTLPIHVPESAWAGSRAEVTLQLLAGGEVRDTMRFNLTVKHVSKWSWRVTGVDLEVDAGGEDIGFTIIQSGNSPSSPHFTVRFLNEVDWNASLPNEFDETLSPGDESVVNLTVTPSATALAGEVVMVELRAREGDGSGLGLVVVPLRVKSSPSFLLHSSGEWLVNQGGGLPLAWVENNGNIVNTVSFEISGLPVGWDTAGSLSYLVGAGESAGFPFEVIPPADWEGEPVEVTLSATDVYGNVENILMTLNQSQTSWATSPFIKGIVGDFTYLEFHSNNSLIGVWNGEGNELAKSSEGWMYPLSPNGGEEYVSVSTGGPTQRLPMMVEVEEAPTRTLACSLTLVNGTETATCEVFEGDTLFRYSAVLRTHDGDIITSTEGLVESNQSASFHLSVGEFNFPVGYTTVELAVYSSSGYLMAKNSIQHLSRFSDWNIGITSHEFVGGEDGKLRLFLSRSNEETLVSPNCMVHLESSNWSGSWSLEITGLIAPSPSLQRPPLKEGESLTIRIGCSAPYDIDENPVDDTLTLVMPPVTLDPIEVGGEVAWVVGGALFMIGLLWAAGYITPPKKKVAKKRRPSSQRPISEVADKQGKSEESGQEKATKGGIASHSAGIGHSSESSEKAGGYDNSISLEGEDEEISIDEVEVIGAEEEVSDSELESISGDSINVQDNSVLEPSGRLSKAEREEIHHMMGRDDSDDVLDDGIDARLDRMLKRRLME